MQFTKEKSVGSYVAEDYRAASVFHKYGIDFCCRGGISIAEASAKNNLDTDKLLSELKVVMSDNNDNDTDFRTWKLDDLADYIVETHHNYITSITPVLRQYLDKICDVHGDHHPELFAIRDHFNDAANNLKAHMQKEEVMLFPYIKKIVQVNQGNTEQKSAIGYGTVKSPIKVMMMEHDAEGERFRQIDALSNNYTIPEDACRTYQVTFAYLKEFESDLHRHIHLENNILFPGAIELEEKLLVN